MQNNTNDISQLDSIESSNNIQDNKIKDLISLCKSRGFIFPAFEVYGGLQGVYDYGPFGVELKNNIKNSWWKDNVHKRDDIEGLDSAILTHSKMLKYSGHIDTFSDIMLDCLNCKARFRIDEIINNICNKCGSNKLTEPRAFNLMFKTNYGPIESNDNIAFLRPETAQGIFSNFRNILDCTSRKLPFGIAQIGKAFRNEITPRNFIFRVREFEQMEIEYFVMPGEDQKWFEYWQEQRFNWWKKQGVLPHKLKLQPQSKEELAHYSKATTDILYEFPHGFQELEGIANRMDFDLGSHTKEQLNLNIQSKVQENKESLTKMSFLNQLTKQNIVPFVIEPSAGVERGMFAILDSAFCIEELPNGNTRSVLKLAKHLAPIKVAIIPLAKNQEAIINKAKEITSLIRNLSIGRVKYEDTGNIGKAYRRHDEIGTPICITIDFETIENTSNNFETVTIRNRDTMQQIRVPIINLNKYIIDFFNTNDYN
ncbi:MAG: glycine--tRNA ligase [Rickettsiales bacterium]